MPTTNVIDGVTTGDAAPAAAPHRISARPTKDTATFTFTPTHDGVLYPSDFLFPGDWYPGEVQDIIAVSIREGGISAYSGTEVGRKGLLCSPNRVCSPSLKCSSWRSPSGTQLAEDVKYAETGAPADGDQTINVWVNTENEGWS